MFEKLLVARRPFQFHQGRWASKGSARKGKRINVWGYQPHETLKCGSQLHWLYITGFITKLQKLQLFLALINELVVPLFYSL